MTLAGAAIVALAVLLVAALAFGGLIVGGKVRGEAHTTLVDVFERRGAAWRARSRCG